VQIHGAKTMAQTKKIGYSAKGKVAKVDPNFICSSQ
jgi:hypothetical protein